MSLLSLGVSKLVANVESCTSYSSGKGIRTNLPEGDVVPSVRYVGGGFSHESLLESVYLNPSLLIRYLKIGRLSVPQLATITDNLGVHLWVHFLRCQPSAFSDLVKLSLVTVPKLATTTVCYDGCATSDLLSVVIRENPEMFREWVDMSFTSMQELSQLSLSNGSSPLHLFAKLYPSLFSDWIESLHLDPLFVGEIQCKKESIWSVLVENNEILSWVVDRGWVTLYDSGRIHLKKATLFKRAKTLSAYYYDFHGVTLEQAVLDFASL